jgi:Flp pilus assembly pilin Flp
VETLRRIGKRDSQQEVGTDMVAIINNALLHVVTAATGLVRRIREESGQDLIEYALLGGGVAIALVLGLVLFDEAIADMVEGIATCIDFQETDGAVGPCP